MAMYGGSSGGRTRMGTKVYLNVYDLSPANDCLHPAGMGLHHSGVEISGVEYSFGSGGGIYEAVPREGAPGARFRERLELGSYEGGSTELRTALDELRGASFGPGGYNLLQRNCNHFADALVRALLGRPIPPHVNRLAALGNYFSCLLPKKMLEASPVGGDGTSAVGGGSGYQVYRTGAAAPAAAFMGRGLRLGSASSEANGSASGAGGDLTDRREKARAAALARAERRQNVGGGAPAEPMQ